MIDRTPHEVIKVCVCYFQSPASLQKANIINLFAFFQSVNEAEGVAISITRWIKSDALFKEQSPSSLRIMQVALPSYNLQFHVRCKIPHLSLKLSVLTEILVM